MPIEPSMQPGETPEPILPSSLPPSPTPLGSSVPPLGSTTPPLGSATPEPLVTPSIQTTTGLEPNIAAGLSTIATFITGIIFLLLEKRDAYVRFWAMQSIVFGVAWLVVAIVFGVIHTFLHALFWPLAVLWGLFSLVVELVFMVIWIVTMIQAFSGKQWEIPFLGKIARQQLARNPNIGL
jgi:uncharacterized membrane protein